MPREQLNWVVSLNCFVSIEYHKYNIPLMTRGLLWSPAVPCNNQSLDNSPRLNKSSPYLLKKKNSLLLKVLVPKSRKQTGERCGGVFPAPVRSPCQRCSSSPARHNSERRRSSRTASAPRSKAGRGVGFMDLRRVDLICDQPAYIKDPVPDTHTHTHPPHTMWSITIQPFLRGNILHE